MVSFSLNRAVARVCGEEKKTHCKCCKVFFSLKPGKKIQSMKSNAREWKVYLEKQAVEREWNGIKLVTYTWENCRGEVFAKWAIISRIS